jgi:adhesin/invasin
LGPGVNSLAFVNSTLLRRSLVIAGLALSLATCRDAFEPGATASIAVAPIFPASADLAAFGLTIDAVRFIVVRPVSDTLADTTLAVLPGATELAVDIRVPVLSSHDSVSITIIAFGGTLPLFSGTRLVPVPTPLPPPEIPLDTYLGPAVDSVVIQPRLPFIVLNDSLRFQVAGFNAGVPVSQFYVAWSTNDTAVARINPLGVLRAPGARASVRVRARTPSGATDSVIATFTPAATQLLAFAGGGQIDTVGQLLATPLEVQARAADGLGVGGVPIRFRALTGGGSVADTLVVTDGAGRARTAATLGALLGAQAFEASAAGLTGSPVAFSAVALAGPVSQILAIAGDGQLAVVGAALASLPSVRVRDAAGNPVAGVGVAFAVASGGGNVTGATPVTDANGVATVGGWTLGTLAGTNTLAATAGALTRTFTATGVAGAATQLLASAGDLQSAVVGTALAIAPAVRALDQFGNPVGGASVTFAPSGGGGGVIGGTQLTNAAGVATVGGWTLGTLAGANALTATLAGLTPVTFTATGLAGAATQIAQLAGDAQTAIVNTILPTAPAVIVRDQFNNPVPDVSVLFAPVSGGGSVTGGSAVSDASGVATVGSWRLGTLVGQNMLTASASGLAGSPVGFTATATRDVASQLLRVSTDTQTATAGQPVGIPPAVRVADQYGNGVPGVSVTFALTGALLGTLTPSVATTDTGGVARVASWTLATLGGVNTLDATVTGLAGSPMTFSATGIVTTATTITEFAGNGQSGVVGAVLPVAYEVTVTNALTLPVPDVPVNWAVDAAGGSMNPVTSLTDVNGRARSMRTLGPGVGTQTATATHGGLPPVTFTATALAGAAVQLVPQSVTQQTGTVATAVTAPVVKVVDQSGNAVEGVIVNFAATGGGTLGATQVTSDAAGIASAGSWTLGSVAGSNTVTVSSVGLANRVFAATGLAGAPDRLRFTLQPTRGLAGDTMAPVQVAIQDKFGNRVPTAQDFVTLGLLPGSNPAAKLVGTSGATAVNGVATFADFAIDSAGFGNALLATAVGRTGDQSSAFDVGGVIAKHTTVRWEPVAAAVNPVTGLVYAPGAGNILGVLDPGKPPVIQVPGFLTPFGVAVNSLTNFVYVTGVAGVIVVDGRNNSIVTTLVEPGVIDPKGIAVDEQSNRAFVAVADPQKLTPPSLVPIDASKNEVLPAIPFEGVEGVGVGVAYNPNDRLVYVAVPAFGLLVFDPATSKQVDKIPLVDKLGRAVGTYGVAVDVRANLVYATNRTEGTVSIIDPVRREELRRVAVGAAPEGVGVDGDRGLAFVGNSGDGTLSIIDTGKLDVIATLVVGAVTSTPKAAAVNATTGQVFVPTFADDQVRVVQP